MWQPKHPARLTVAIRGFALMPLINDVHGHQTGDQALRAVADAENTRRRAQEDIAKAHKYGIESFAEALLPVVDSLEKALQVQHATPEAMREVVEAAEKTHSNQKQLPMRVLAAIAEHLSKGP